MTANANVAVDLGQISVFVDVAALLNGTLPKPPEPVLLARRDGQKLFYGGKVNVLYGDPECGKTWIAYSAVVEALLAGWRCLIIDADHNGASEVLHRLLRLGAPVDLLKNQAIFRLTEPEDSSELLTAVAACLTWQPHVVVVDSIGEVVPMLGLNSNLPDDYTNANRRTLGAMAKGGAAVIGIDHMSKGTQSRQQGQGGANAKRRAVNGLSVRVTLDEPFAPGRIGSAFLRIDKDRPGAVRRDAPGRSLQVAGVFHLDSTRDGSSTWWITAPTDDDAEAAADAEGDSDQLTPRSARKGTWNASPADLAEIDAIALRLGKHPTVREVKDASGWGGTRATEVTRTWKQMHLREEQP